MAFHDILFPVEVRSLSATPSWPVDVIKTAAAEQRISGRPDSLRQYEAAHSTLTFAQARAIYKFFNGRRGQLHSFKLRDKLLYQATAAPIGTAGGPTSTMQLLIDEGDAANSYLREIYLPESGTVVIRAGVTVQTEGVDYTLNYTGANGGKLTWITDRTGQVITADFNFYVPVRFDVQSLPDIEMIRYRSNNTGSATGPIIPMLEVDYPGEWS